MARSAYPPSGDGGYASTVHSFGDAMLFRHRLATVATLCRSTIWRRWLHAVLDSRWHCGPDEADFAGDKGRRLEFAEDFVVVVVNGHGQARAAILKLGRSIVGSLLAQHTLVGTAAAEDPRSNLAPACLIQASQVNHAIDAAGPCTDLAWLSNGRVDFLDMIGRHDGDQPIRSLDTVEHVEQAIKSQGRPEDTAVFLRPSNTASMSSISAIQGVSSSI